MSAFGTDFDLASSDLLQRMGDPVTYTPSGGTAVVLSALVGDEQTEEITEEQGLVWRRARDVALPRTAAAGNGGNYVDRPSLHGTVTIGGVSYAIERMVSQTQSLTTLHVVRPEVAERSRRGYRT